MLELHKLNYIKVERVHKFPYENYFYAMKLWLIQNCNKQKVNFKLFLRLRVTKVQEKSSLE